MNSINPPQSTNSFTSISQHETVGISILSGFTWIVALLFTILTVVFRLSYMLVANLLHYCLKCSVYLLLGTLFVCSAFVLIVLSIMTLGAISLP
ncbi:hypothetical protein [Desulfopila sp. IMCC35008]|uniref:hypothetical protein n=1 Tax=Desulfopila sp. IMCC35008 TaxID=2653858 RepID=UPI0013D87D48|nr:hypothetical protein [Desulfopila sp. IMCC35008]